MPLAFHLSLVGEQGTSSPRSPALNFPQKAALDEKHPPPRKFHLQAVGKHQPLRVNGEGN